MKFLDPTSDLMFKKLFANQAKSSIVIDFLNSILGRSGDRAIVSVTITDPYNNPDTNWLKKSIVDARCTDAKGNNYIVEMQVDYQSDYKERAQYYAALAISRQLETAEAYKKIMPVIFIGVLGFIMFPNKNKYISHHDLRDRETNEQDLGLSEFCFIELTKFNKSLEQLESVEDKWIYFLKNASKLDVVPPQLNVSKAFAEAFHAVEQGAQSKEELATYDRQIENRRVELSLLLSAEEKGEIKGRKEGLNEGLNEGRKEGRKEGQVEVAKRLLLKKMAVIDVAEATGLTVEEIEKLS